jgi:Cysteine-rich CPXCG
LLASESITCPYCWEVIEIVLDLSVAEQAYVEDCSVCCRPISIRYRTDEDGGVSVEAVADGEA